MKIILSTVSALIAFAMNSILCRLALGEGAIDPATFTSIRLVSGALTLLLISVLRNRATSAKLHWNWISAALLFLYAIAFSLAYINLSVGTGALILFGSVQVTMISAALFVGERPGPLEWLGLVIALCGFLYLVFPGLKAPPPLNSALMAVAGVAWGFYSLKGRRNTDPLAATTGNFVLAVPLILAVNIVLLSRVHITSKGALYAALSGAFASGVGYVIWYAALKGLSATRAAAVQLAVPLLAALGGDILLNETITARLVLAGVLILGGVGLVVIRGARPSRR